jgi:hypothetical protein
MDGITDEELTNKEFKKPLTETKDENGFTLKHLEWLNSHTNLKALKYNNEEVTNIIDKFENNEPFINEKSEYTFIRQISDIIYDNILYKVPASRSITEDIDFQSEVQYNVPDSAWKPSIADESSTSAATDIY